MTKENRVKRQRVIGMAFCFSIREPGRGAAPPALRGIVSQSILISRLPICLNRKLSI